MKINKSENTKRLYLYWTIFLLSFGFILFELIGRATGFIHLGPISLPSWIREFTYQSSLLICMLYFLLILYRQFKFDKLKIFEKNSIKDAFGSYIFLTMIVAIFILGPFMFWGPDYSLHPIPPGPVNISHAPWLVSTVFFHVIVPGLVLYDITKHRNTESDKPLNWKKTLYWSLYPIIFITVSMFLGVFYDGFFPYAILDPWTVGYGYIGFIALISLIYLGILWYINWNDSRQFKEKIGKQA